MGYIDADMARDVDSRKSTSVYLVTFVEEACLGNPSCSELFYLPQKQHCCYRSLQRDDNDDTFSKRTKC